MKRWSGALVLASACVLGGCDARREQPAAQAPETAAPPTTVSQAGYAPPPRVESVGIGHDGDLEIRGRAGRDGQVRAVAANGQVYGAASGGDGGFLIATPALHAPLLMALSFDAARTAAPAPGWLFVPPDAPARAVMLVPGAPARPVGAGAGLIAATDFDAAGGASVSGVAPPGTTVTVSVDGAPVARAVAAADGAFGARLGDLPLSAGAHDVRVAAGVQSLSRTLRFVNAPAPAGQPMTAQREPDGWRVGWSPPGGGGQTTFVLAPRPGA